MYIVGCERAPSFSSLRFQVFERLANEDGMLSLLRFSEVHPVSATTKIHYNISYEPMFPILVPSVLEKESLYVDTKVIEIGPTII